MASTKQNDVSKPGPPDVSRVQGLNLNHPKIESFSGISDENDRNSNLSPSKSADPSRKKMFKITSVKKGGGGTGDVGGDNDADSVDGLDESQTEDISSEFYDSSKATDLDMDLQDCMNIPLTPDEVTSTTTIVVKQKPDQNSQSRFKVVKIETKEPFRRGKWVCYDFFDTAPASVVMVEKNDSKATEDSVIQSALSGNLSLSSSVHYVQDVNDSSSNIFIPPVVSPARNDGHHMPSDAFVPIQPAPASQVLNQLDGLSSDIMAPFIAQQVLMSVAGVPSSSNSFHNLAQPGHTTIIQNLPHNNIFPYAQNGPPVGLYQNGVTAGQTSEVMSLPADAMIAAVGSGAPTLIATAAPAVGSSSIVHSQAFPIVSAVQVPHSLSQTQIAGDTIVSQGVPPVIETAASTVLGPGIPSSMAHVPHSRTDTVAATTSLEVGEQMGPAMSESTDSIKTLQGDTDGQASEGLKEAVEAVGEMYMGLEGNEEDQDESGGGSTVAIDNKIEQAMDLVKRHLMYAVREEVEILKQQIGEMMERIGQLEYENTVLRSEARPETLNKLLQPRVVTSSQPAVPGQATPMLVTPAPQQTPAQPPSQPQPSLQTTHPPSQQHLSQTTTAQAPQPPPSTSSS